jgi:predicted RNA methylase
MVEFKKDGIKYKVTDTRLLNETGVEVIKRCILHMLNEGPAICTIELGETIDD